MALRLAGHPVPDIPVRGIFQDGGSARIEVEVDPRCFADDPENEPYLLKGELDGLPAPRRALLFERAGKLIRESIEFHFEPTGQFLPQFEFEFTGPAGAQLKEVTDPVMITGRWRTTIVEGLTGYRVVATPRGKLSVVFLNEVNGQPLTHVSVLFPGESSYVLPLARLAGVAPTAAGAKGEGPGGLGATFVEFVRQGFIHVIPLGWDHILFVLGLFLLSRQWGPLLWQVTMFTLAHTITLALATLGKISAPAEVVEPVIAASIAVIALENILRPKYSPWRLAVVFVFGLIHGLGFAGALRELDLPAPSLAAGLLGFNIGVEFGQLAVLAGAWIATVWLRREEVYRRVVTVPASIAIAACGVWWTVERIAFR